MASLSRVLKHYRSDETSNASSRSLALARSYSSLGFRGWCCHLGLWGLCFPSKGLNSFSRAPTLSLFFLSPGPDADAEVTAGCSRAFRVCELAQQYDAIHMTIGGNTLLLAKPSSTQPEGGPPSPAPSRVFAHWEIGIIVQFDAVGQYELSHWPPHHKTRTLNPNPPRG